MIGADLRFEGFDSESWTNLLSLFDPGLDARVHRRPAMTDASEAAVNPERAPQGTLVVVIDDQRRVLTALHSGRGAIEGLELASAETLCRQRGAARCFILRRGVIEELFDRLAVELQPSDDYVQQWLRLARLMRTAREAGRIESWPGSLARVPIPASTTVDRAFDLVLPEGHAITLVLWEGSRIWTAATLHRERGALRAVFGPDALTRWAGPLGGDFSRDYRVIADAVTRSLGPLHFGAFAEASTLRRLVRDRSAGAWARAVAVREVIVHPTPPSIALALGADAVGAALRASSRLLGGLDLNALLAPVVGAVREHVFDLRSLSSILGFDPLEALAAWTSRKAAPPNEPDERG